MLWPKPAWFLVIGWEALLSNDKGSFHECGRSITRTFMHEINAKLGVDMPITDTTYRILYEKMAPMMEMRLLSDRLA